MVAFLTPVSFHFFASADTHWSAGAAGDSIAVVGSNPLLTISVIIRSLFSLNLLSRSISEFTACNVNQSTVIACASRHQYLGKPFRGQVSAQSFLACPIEDEARHCGELPAELVIARFVGEQGLLVRSGPFDPSAAVSDLPTSINSSEATGLR
jgi:hypothetical protein